MSEGGARLSGQLERELAYYRRECNDLGARLLNLQEEQSRAFREARRSRMVAKLIREAYRLSDAGSSPQEIGLPMLGVIVENAMCDAAAFLTEEGPGCGRFVVTDAVGVARRSEPERFVIPDPPASFFTSSKTRISLATHELMDILRVPYVFWAYDRASGHALILGNRSEGNVSRAFEAADQELIEGALSVYLDVLSRKQAEFDLRQAKASLEEANAATAVVLATVDDDLSAQLDAIVSSSDRLRRMVPFDFVSDDHVVCADRIHEAGRHLVSLVAELMDYGRIARGDAPMQSERMDLGFVIGEAARANAALAEARRIALEVLPTEPDLAMTADRFRLRLLVNSLLSNALRLVPPGGAVAIGCGRHRGGGVEVTVRETHAGAEPAAADGSASRARKGGTGVQAGAGLGLAIARELCHAHGGWLVLEGTADRGAVVRAVFPDDGSDKGR